MNSVCDPLDADDHPNQPDTQNNDQKAVSIKFAT